MIKVMFVCHGNICRSTMAEFVLKDLVKKRGCENFVIASAATSYEEIGNDTHYGTKEVLRRHGVPFTRRAAARLTKADCENFDYIIGMDTANIRNILNIGGAAAQGKTYMLLEFAGLSRSIADPWYTGDFDTTYNDVVMGCNAFLDSIL